MPARATCAADRLIRLEYDAIQVEDAKSDVGRATSRHPAVAALATGSASVGGGERIVARRQSIPSAASTAAAAGAPWAILPLMVSLFKVRLPAAKN